MGTNLVGQYQFKQGFLKNNLHFLQIKRRRSVPNKPQFYIVFLNSDESETYISSLYLQDDWNIHKTYHFDFENISYSLTLDEWDNIATIKRVGVKRAITQKKKQWGDAFGGRSSKTPNKAFLDNLFNS